MLTQSMKSQKQMHSKKKANDKPKFVDPWEPFVLSGVPVVAVLETSLKVQAVEFPQGTEVQIVYMQERYFKGRIGDLETNIRKNKKVSLKEVSADHPLAVVLKDVSKVRDKESVKAKWVEMDEKMIASEEHLIAVVNIKAGIPKLKAKKSDEIRIIAFTKAENSFIGGHSNRTGAVLRSSVVFKAVDSSHPLAVRLHDVPSVEQFVLQRRMEKRIGNKQKEVWTKSEDILTLGKAPPPGYSEDEHLDEVKSFKDIEVSKDHKNEKWRDGDEDLVLENEQMIAVVLKKFGVSTLKAKKGAEIQIIAFTKGESFFIGRHKKLF
jgi:hypothetical protein